MTTGARVTLNLSIHNLPRVEIDEREIAKWIEGRLNDARNHFIRSVSHGTRSGRVYGKRRHRASAPGEYPRTDGGQLVNSVDYQMDNPLQGRLHSDVRYAAFLTDGTTRMAPRKMLVEAVNWVLTERPKNDDLARAVKLHGGTFYG